VQLRKAAQHHAEHHQGRRHREIDGHEHVLAHLEDAARNTINAPLRQMLVKASGKVQEHLTKAKARKEKYPKS
jgi:hypothetical protein